MFVCVCLYIYIYIYIYYSAGNNPQYFLTIFI